MTKSKKFLQRIRKAEFDETILKKMRKQFNEELDLEVLENIAIQKHNAKQENLDYEILKLRKLQSQLRKEMETA